MYLLLSGIKNSWAGKQYVLPVLYHKGSIFCKNTFSVLVEASYFVEATWPVSAHHHHAVARKVAALTTGTHKMPLDSAVSTFPCAGVCSFARAWWPWTLSGWEVTASKPELSQSNFTDPPVGKKIPPGGREGGKERQREGESDGDKGELLREATQLSPSLQCTN